MAGNAWAQEGPVLGMAIPELGKMVGFSEVEAMIFVAIEETQILL